MDPQKVLEELAAGEFGDHVRAEQVKDMVDDLRGSGHDDEREWADSVADWLEEWWL